MAKHPPAPRSKSQIKNSSNEKRSGKSKPRAKSNAGTKRSKPTSDSDESVPRKKQKRSRHQEDTDSEENEEDEDDEENEETESSDSNSSENRPLPWYCDSQDIDNLIATDWSTDDELVLKDTSSEEISLWTKSLRSFVVAPADLLPEDQDFTTMTRDYGTNANGQHIENTNMATRLCAEFARVIWLPVFQIPYGNPSFISYCVSLAMHFKLGNRHVDMPRISDFHLGAHRLLFDVVEKRQNVTIRSQDQKHYEELLIDNNHSDLPRFWEFVGHIQEAVKSYKKMKVPISTIGRADMVAILDAWNLYVAAEATYLHKHEKLWKKQRYNKGVRTLTSTDVLQIKKKWLMAQRLILRREAEQGRLESEIRASSELGSSANELPSPAIQEQVTVSTNKTKIQSGVSQNRSNNSRQTAN